MNTYTPSEHCADGGEHTASESKAGNNKPCELIICIQSCLKGERHDREVEGKDAVIGLQNRYSIILLLLQQLGQNVPGTGSLHFF